MTWRSTLTAALTLAGVGLFLGTAIYVWRRPRSSAATSLVLVLLSTTVWSVAYVFELTAADQAMRALWGDLKYIGILALPPTWFAFTFQYTGKGRLVNRRTIAALLIQPIVVLALLFNPSTHDLVRYYPPNAGPGDPALGGPLYWPHLAYISVMLWTCTGMLVVTLSRISRLYRRQALTLIATILVPFVANLLYSFNVVTIDLSPFAFSLTALVLVWGVLHLRLLDLAPLARGSLFEMMPDAVIVLDAYQRVADLNPAARDALGLPGLAALGRQIHQLVPQFPELTEASGIVTPASAATNGTAPAGERASVGGDDDRGIRGEVELTLHRDGVARIWELSVSALHGQDHRLTGWLLVLRDVTERRQAQERLRQVNEARRSLLARVVDAQEQERRRIASDIHDDSIQAMAAAVMRLQLVRKRSHDADQLEKIDALESALAQAIERLRHLLFHLRPPVLDELGLAAALRQYLEYSKPEDGWEARVEANSTAELSTELRVTAYRIAQEAISNARRHARAQTLLVRIEDARGGLRVLVRDDGTGFDPDGPERLDSRPGHLGIAGMRERASMAGGWWRLDSAIGQGTLVEFWLPVSDEPPSLVAEQPAAVALGDESEDKGSQPASAVCAASDGCGPVQGTLPPANPPPVNPPPVVSG